MATINEIGQSHIWGHKKIPKEETYSLTNQIRRAAISVPSNLAEGHAMKTTPHYVKFIYIKRRSPAELETQLMIANDLEYAEMKELKPILEETGNLSRVLRKMIFSLNRKMDLSSISLDPSELVEEP